MFADSDLYIAPKFCGNYMLAKLDDNLRIKLRFVTGGTAQKYTGLKAEIINKTDGLVDSQVLKFGDIIGLRNSDVGKSEPYVWEYNHDIDWYYPVSAREEKMIADKVSEYAEMYCEHGMTQSM